MVFRDSKTISSTYRAIKQLQETQLQNARERLEEIRNENNALLVRQKQHQVHEIFHKQLKEKNEKIETLETAMAEMQTRMEAMEERLSKTLTMQAYQIPEVQNTTQELPGSYQEMGQAQNFPNESDAIYTLNNTVINHRDCLESQNQAILQLQNEMKEVQHQQATTHQQHFWIQS
ncbi:hypothetical protein L596_025922 [Steinernema carpocapsae]|uniref:Uncharacterized protein n=1 Tax=Steinernema carpocapsae TaxID=34508 RepID=A0A4U5M971_STECR|nr:hypothetical protein L596_025922 [Steinernema carpocapsae]